MIIFFEGGQVLTDKVKMSNSIETSLYNIIQFAEVNNALYFCSWLRWNQSNKKKYFIFLHLTQQPVCLTFMRLIDVNYQLPLKVFI